MRTAQELDRLREQAIALRRTGKSRREIKEILGPMSNSTLNDALMANRLPSGLAVLTQRMTSGPKPWNSVAKALTMRRSSPP
jgi:transposase